MTGIIEVISSFSLSQLSSLATIGAFMIAIIQLNSIGTKLNAINHNINDIDIEVNPDISIEKGFKEA